MQLSVSSVICIENRISNLFMKKRVDSQLLLPKSYVNGVTLLCRFTSSQLMSTMSDGKMHGSSLLSGKFCLSLFSVSSVPFGHHHRAQRGKYHLSHP